MSNTGRYKEKTEEELIWDDTRLTLVRLIDLEISKQRRRILNMVLPAAHKKHMEAIKSGTLKELENEYTALVQAVVSGINTDELVTNVLGGPDDPAPVEGQ